MSILGRRLKSIKSNINGRDLARYGTRKVTQAALSPTGEPQRAYMWEINFIDGGETAKNLTYYAESVEIPEQSNEFVMSRYLDEEFEYHYRDSTERTITINFWDSDKLEVYRFFEGWRQMTSDPIERRTIRGRDKVSRDVELVLKDNTDFVVSGKIMFTDCLISSIGAISVDYSNNDVLKFPVTLKYFGRKVK